MSLALTGAGAAPSKVINTALEIWRDDVNAKGGLLGRPVELVIYDDQSTPANVPSIYTKLITVDKVDLLLGPYGTNFVAPAMPTIIQNKKMTISFTAIGINGKFNYDKYFSMVSVGPEGVNSFSIGFFDMAAAQKPKPQTVAILAADAEFAQGAAQGAREEIKKHGFKLVYDKSYPPSTTDFGPVVRAVQATNPDIVYHRRLSAGQRRHHPRRQRDRAVAQDVGRRDDRHAGDADQGAAWPDRQRPDHRRKLRRRHGQGHSGRAPNSSSAIRPRPRRPASTRWASPGRRSPTAAARCWRRRSPRPRASITTSSPNTCTRRRFKTVAGNFTFAKNGEWAKPRMDWTQVQNAQPNNLDQFRDGKAQPIVWPPEAKTGTLIYPYGDARKK